MARGKEERGWVELGTCGIVSTIKIKVKIYQQAARKRATKVPSLRFTLNKDPGQDGALRSRREQEKRPRAGSVHTPRLAQALFGGTSNECWSHTPPLFSATP